MALKESALKKHFLKGNYRDAIDFGEANPDQILSSEFPFWIGALSFQGRLEEAEESYRARRLELKVSDKVACRFFLGIAHSRLGTNSRAHNHLLFNLKAMRRTKSPRIRFFALQGLSFYRYVHNRFKSALRASERAWGSASLVNFDYGRALAGDLSGHCFIQTGNLSAGFARLQEAERIARSLGDGGLARSIQMSQVVYQAQFGIDSHQVMQRLETARTNLDPQNTHALSSLLLETANQLMLRGQLQKAAGVLAETSALIYRIQHRRYGNLLSLRFAELGYRRGDYASCLHAVKAVRSTLDQSQDLNLVLMALGMELKIIQKISPEYSQKTLLDELRHLTNLSGRSISISILDREKAQEDLLAQNLLSFESADRSRVITRILQTPYHSRLYEALSLPHSARAILLGPSAKECAVLDRGEVRYHEKGLTQQVRAVFTALRRQEHSKAELVQKIWGYDYHPVRHGPAVYAAIARARDLLGHDLQWIEATEDGYRLHPDVQVIDLQSSLRENSPSRAEAGEQEKFEPLNFRQLEILQNLQKKIWVKIDRPMMNKFGVTDMTLRRDFLELIRQGRVEKSGQARATRYRLI